MGKMLLNIIFKVNRIGIIIFPLIVLLVVSCYDNFDDSIKNENKYTDPVEITEPDENWIKLNDIAVTPRAGTAYVIQGDWLYVYGGETYSESIIADFWRYNLSTGVYQSLTSIGARAYATLVDLNGSLYLFGGIDASGTLHDDKIMYYYNTSTNAWSSFNNSDTNSTWPAVRYYHTAVPVYDSANSVESIYFHGGKNASGTNLGGSLYEIDFTATPKYDWISYSQTSSLIRSEHAAVYYNDNIYFFGGYNSGTYYNDLWKFDLTTSKFSELITTGITIVP